MGNCVGGSKKVKGHDDEQIRSLRKISMNFNNKVHEQELMLLHLIFTDLAARISENELSL